MSTLSLVSVMTSPGFDTICQSFEENSLWVIDGMEYQPIQSP